MYTFNLDSGTTTATDKGDTSLQDRFKRFRKGRKQDLRHKAYTQKKVGRRSDLEKDRLRAKFVAQVRSYMGVPYARKYHEPGTADFNAPLFLDCCALVRRAQHDLQEEFGFRLGRWNQCYQFDTLPLKIKQEELRPGDLVFVEGRYHGNKKQQINLMTHVEVFIGNDEDGGKTGEQTIGARWQKGHVEVHPSFKFSSKSYEILRYHFCSIDTWLDGVCKSHVAEREWRDDRVRWQPGATSIFADGDSDDDDDDDAAEGAEDVADTAGGPRVAEPQDECKQGKQGKEAATTTPMPRFFVGKSNGWKLVADALLARGWSQVPFEHAFSRHFEIKWVERRAQIDYAAFKEGHQLVNHIPNNDVLTSKANLISLLQDAERAGEDVSFFPASYRLDLAADRLRFLRDRRAAFAKQQQQQQQQQHHTASTADEGKRSSLEEEEEQQQQQGAPQECDFDVAMSYLHDTASPRSGKTHLEKLREMTLSSSSSSAEEGKSQAVPMPLSCATPPRPARTAAAGAGESKTGGGDGDGGGGGDDISSGPAMVDGYWICKPSSKNRGRGIHVLRDLSPLFRQLLPSASDAAEEGKKDGSGINEWVFGSGKGADGGDAAEHAIQTADVGNMIIQRYVHRPLLLEGDRKFDIRAYCLVARTAPHALVLYHGGYVRLSLEGYTLDEARLGDQFVHLTNAAVQKKHADYGARQSIWSMERLGTHLEDEARVAPRGWTGRRLPAMIKGVMATTIAAATREDRLERKRGYFDLLGFDLMLDEDLKLHLIEVNTNPALHLDCDELKALLPPMVDETLQIVLAANEVDEEDVAKGGRKGGPARLAADRATHLEKMQLQQQQQQDGQSSSSSSGGGAAAACLTASWSDALRNFEVVLDEAAGFRFTCPAEAGAGKK